jgi:hypothetical protein
MRRKILLRAVIDEDIGQILSACDLLSDFQEGKIACASCGCNLNWNNLGALKPSKSGMGLICDNPDCLASAKGGCHAN